jgi:hypothetical protein
MTIWPTPRPQDGQECAVLLIPRCRRANRQEMCVLDAVMEAPVVPGADRLRSVHQGHHHGRRLPGRLKAHTLGRRCLVLAGNSRGARTARRIRSVGSARPTGFHLARKGPADMRCVKRIA